MSNKHSINNKLYSLRKNIKLYFMFNKDAMSYILRVSKFFVLFGILQSPLLLLMCIWLIKNNDSVKLSMLLPFFVIYLFYTLLMLFLSLAFAFFIRRKYFFLIHVCRYLLFFVACIISIFVLKYIVHIPDDTIEGWYIIISLLFYPLAMLLFSLFFAFEIYLSSVRRR